MQQKIPLGIRSLQHIGITVTDIERSKDFYERLGFVSAMEAPFNIDGEKGTCMMVQQAGIMVELYQLPEAQLQEVRNRSNGRIDHIAFDVEDIDKFTNSTIVNY